MVELDGQGIERRDFPISRRGYEPAAVDAHLAAVAAAVLELRREASRGESLGASAASQVQSILDAAEATAAEIVSEAQRSAEQTIASAAAEASRTRGDAVAKAQAHVAAVSEATAALRAKLDSMDGEIGDLVDRLRGGASRLSSDLSAAQRDMASIYDRAPQPPGSAIAPAAAQAPAPPASAQAQMAPASAQAQTPPAAPAPAVPAAPAAPAPAPAAPAAANGLARQGAGAAPPPGPPPAAPARSPEPPAEEVVSAEAAAPGQSGGAPDVDGARLIALNMALNGDSREATDRYLAEHYDLPDREKLIEEVYAAIEG